MDGRSVKGDEKVFYLNNKSNIKIFICQGSTSDPSETGRKPVGTSDAGKRDILKQQHATREQQKSVKIIIIILYD